MGDVRFDNAFQVVCGEKEKASYGEHLPRTGVPGYLGTWYLRG